MASMAVSRLISVKDMKSLVGQVMTYEQISEKFRIKHPSSKGLSSMSVQRSCKKNIGRNCMLNKEELMKEVFQCSSEVNFVTVISVFEKIYPVY